MRKEQKQGKFKQGWNKVHSKYWELIKVKMNFFTNFSNFFGQNVSFAFKNYPNGLKTLLAHKNGKISGNLTNRGL